MKPPTPCAEETPLARVLRLFLRDLPTLDHHERHRVNEWAIAHAKYFTEHGLMKIAKDWPIVKAELDRLTRANAEQAQTIAARERTILDLQSRVPTEADAAADAELDAVAQRITAANKSTQPQASLVLPAGLKVQNDRIVTLDGNTVYTFDGDPDTQNPAAWVPVRDGDGTFMLYEGKQLYTYSGDTDANPIAGVAVDPQWHLVSPPIA